MHSAYLAWQTVYEVTGYHIDQDFRKIDHNPIVLPPNAE